MKIKYLAVAFAVLGMLGSLLPFVSVSIEGADPALVSKMEKQMGEETSPNAWKFKADRGGHPGALVCVVLGLAALLGGAIAATRLSRGLAVPTAAVAAIGLIVSRWAWVRSSHEEQLRSVLLKVGPSVGFYLMLLALLGIAAVSLRGALKPEAKLS